MSIKTTYTKFNEILVELKNDYTVFAPVRFSSIGTHSDNDIIRYDKIDDVTSIVHNEKSHFSPKEIYFPITQILFHFSNNEQHVPEIDEKKHIIIMRPCDINSLSVFESIFIKNSNNFEDFYYKRLRDKIKIFMLECKDGFDSCFCVSIGMNKTDNYDVALRFTEDNILCHIKSEEFQSYFNKKGENTHFIPQYVEKNSKTVEIPDIYKITLDMFNDDIWTEYTQRCIACGRCNFVCPTCTCWSMQDVQYEEKMGTGERRRVWASCHVDGYTDMAGGHSFRRSNGERMRFKVFHKIYDFKKRFGYNMCTGCGRCDDICPEYISYSNSINKVTKFTKGEWADGK
jgi:anaerobic sulfite reductase subunit A